MGLWPKLQAAISPHADYGFFGPGSVTWKVWSYPTSLTVGFQRAVVVEELRPGAGGLGRGDPGHLGPAALPLRPHDPLLRPGGVRRLPVGDGGGGRAGEGAR